MSSISSALPALLPPAFQLQPMEPRDWQDLFDIPGGEDSIVLSSRARSLLSGPETHDAPTSALQPPFPYPVDLHPVDLPPQRRRWVRFGKSAPTPAASPAISELHIGASFSVASSLLPRLRAEFCPRHPNVRVYTTGGTEEEIRQLLFDGILEIGLFSDAGLLEGMKIQPYCVPGSQPSVLLFFASLNTGTAARMFIQSAILGHRRRSRR